MFWQVTEPVRDGGACGDQRDYDFAKHFGIDIPNIFEGVDISEEAFADKENTVIANSDFLNGLSYKEATKKVIAELEKLGQGEGKVNYRLRDAVFSRQRYWGEPFPVYYDGDGLPHMIEEEHLPITLPEVDKYLPTETGEPPLGNATEWAWDTVAKKVVANSKIDNKTVFALDLNTMPGWAGSSQYFNRYMDPQNDQEIFSQEAINYWQDVDLYIGGSEHATGHLLYSRFWQKFMFDKGLVPKDEFAKKLINQGMITGTSAFVHRLEMNWCQKGFSDEVNFYSGKHFSGDLIVPYELWKQFPDSKKEPDAWFDHLAKLVKPVLNVPITDLRFISVELVSLHVDISLVNSSNEIDVNELKRKSQIFKRSIFLDRYANVIGNEGGKYLVTREVEKMSKSKYNVVNPDAICEEFGADSLRLYEMFLGPLEQSKPWNTAGITGVHSFLKKLWRLYHGGADGAFEVSDEEPNKDSWKTLHKTIKKVEEDIENFSFNTSVSTFMIAVNELSSQKCASRKILEPLIILVSPYAPHIAEELWQKLGHDESISEAPFPKFEEKYLVESSKEYPISFNGKMRFKLELPLDLSKDEIESAVMAHEKTQQQLQVKRPKK